MTELLLIARGEIDLSILPKMANRHGIIAGATGTGKTVTLQQIAESFSRIGVPVVMADVKGDLSGICQPGGGNQKITDRLAQLKITDFPYAGCPVEFWDVFGDQGHPLRSTVSEMGPLLLSRLLNLNETQSGVLSLVFKVADDQGMLLLDLKDLRAMLQFCGDHGKELTTEYGNVSAASVGAIQRGLLQLEEQGGEKFFGEPAVDLNDFMQTDSKGQGVINLLAADKLINSPKVYTTFLLWLLSELFENLPEVGDLDKPKLLFFFDEAHLIFDDAPKILLDKIEQVVRLVRSKGVGVYFVTQNPLDIPDVVLGQLGNQVQHAIRAYTPRDLKAVNAAAQTFRSNPGLNVVKELQELSVGEALVSFLDEKGVPGVVQKAFIIPPTSRIGPADEAVRKAAVIGSPFYGHYENAVDRESAFEILKGKAEAASAAAASQQAAQPAPNASGAGAWGSTGSDSSGVVYTRRSEPPKSQQDSMVSKVAGSVVRAFGTSVARQLGSSIVRGMLGGILGGSSTRRRR
jgi:DNA helicase HerA-like ATPase